MDQSPGYATTSAPKKKKKRITIVMDPCVNNIVNDIYFNKQATGNLANPSAIEAPSQNAEAKGTNTECESGVDGKVSVSQSPICPPAHAKSKSRKQGTNTECESGVDGKVSVLQSPIYPPAHAKSKSLKPKRRNIRRCLLKNDVQSKTREGASRLGLTQSVMETEGTNSHTCLVDAMDPCVNNKPSAIKEPSQNADAEGTNTECASGVGRKQRRHIRRRLLKNDIESKTREGGSRPVLNQSVMETEGTNRHTCIIDAMDPCVNNKPLAIKEPSQNAEAEGTNTECEAGVGRKRKCPTVSKHLLRNDATSKTRKGGSRLILNQSVLETEGTNRRTCLVDAICGIIPVNEVKNSVRRSIIMAMPSQGDTSISHANNALASHGMVLNRASKRYMREGGAPFHLLQEQKCRLVIQIKLTNHDNQTMCHFVSWDGHTIHDSPYNSKVNDTFDRASKKGSDNVFEKMYRRDFKNWQITNVYDLLDLNP